MNILVTGGAGYVGSVLIPSLIKHGHYVKCLDRFFFGTEYLSDVEFQDKIELIREDIRWFDSKILNQVDAVLDLAALSNDPVGELDPKKTFEINHLGRVRVANLSKKMGVSQYILASSASIYGQQSGRVNENSDIHPLTSYSKANRNAEVDVLKLNNDGFCVTVLRFSSIYGVSARMRFDIAVNSMVLDLYKSGKIIVRGKNNQRPFVHIKDVTNAYLNVLKASKEKISGQIFNVGSDEQNYRIEDLAKLIGESIGKKYEIELGDNKDYRSYVASFKKIRETLGFHTEFFIKDGVREIYRALEKGVITDSLKTITVKWYKHIQSNKELYNKVSLNGKIL